MSGNYLSNLMAVLKGTKDSESLHSVEKAITELLVEGGASQALDDSWVLDRSARVSLAMQAISLGAEPEIVVNLLSWKDFEGLVAGILEENDYRCVESFRRRGTSKMQGMEIDVIGVRGERIIAVDAKLWGVRTGKSSALRSAAERQRERTARLCGEMERLAEKIGSLPHGTYTLTPILVTWLVEEVILNQGVPVVPVFKLNSFILEISNYEDMIVCYECRY
ncbi:MAG: restriction endonuclease [Candidatus Thorarchaeota archaeon]|nr:MAG: restriction endonuclease [Candidatus Thorarchaeota archaeon]